MGATAATGDSGTGRRHAATPGMEWGILMLWWGAVGRCWPLAGGVSEVSSAVGAPYPAEVPAEVVAPYLKGGAQPGGVAQASWGLSLGFFPCSEVTHGALLSRPLPDENKQPVGVVVWDTPRQGKAGEALGDSLRRGA